jgi:small subunit ribosomal protein S20
MANTKSAAKRARQTERRTLNNRRALTMVKSQLKSVRVALASGNKETAKAAAQSFVSALDKAVKSGRVHSNSAARHKSNVSKALAQLV